ncbi:MAG TPA: DUF5658 family protein [Planctomycetota bacterium]|jgi:hypothetical protein|nr:hypothetical protein [Planctomycetota bacterium]OQC21981.1 MAG: hypothetical protein BWX69_00289 [Planctomycetes bacterium ADurb.Bin069]HNR98134.1 DUF5658 family protein [Planctomycetota bacterium]HNU25503.1 DUF5658 family protein [Planctomycetota bacterium]HOE28563.1 DUF5658 family protein [Planctomycetota bacterium]
MIRQPGLIAFQPSAREDGRRVETGGACAAARGRLAFSETAAWACVIFLLCVLDTACTVIHVRGGATEINPLMNYVLAMGPEFFVALKVVVSMAALGVLCVLLPRVRRGRMCFLLVGAPYFAVCCYHASGFVG